MLAAATGVGLLAVGLIAGLMLRPERKNRNRDFKS
jgi:hypothetical protein